MAAITHAISIFSMSSLDPWFWFHVFVHLFIYFHDAFVWLYFQIIVLSCFAGADAVMSAECLLCCCFSVPVMLLCCRCFYCCFSAAIASKEKMNQTNLFWMHDSHPSPNFEYSGNSNCIQCNTSFKTTARGFEPLRAEPNGFQVHPLSRSGTVSSACWDDVHILCLCSCSHGRPTGSLCRQVTRSVTARNDTEGIRTPAGRAQWISSPSP